MKNIHLIETDKPSRLWTNNLRRRLELDEFPSQHPSNIAKNIYITNDEEIKEGDWVIVNKKYIRKVDITFNKQDSDWNVLNTNKIILTTDQDLIKDGVQPIDDEFLEWFVKNPSCEKVETKVGFIQSPDNLKDGFYYKIIIPKEEPLQEFERSITIIDPPSGWKYGFPKPIPEDRKNDVLVWLVEQGYPQSEIDGLEDYFPCRYWEQDEQIKQVITKTAMQELLEFCEYRQTKATDNCKAAWNMILAKIKDDGLVEMEKEQIIHSHLDGQSLVSCKDEYAEQYYNETFKNK